MWWLGLAVLSGALCARQAHTIRVACELTMGSELHTVAVGADGNSTVSQLAELAGSKLVKKLRLRTGVVLSDLETEGAWLDPDDQLWLLQSAHGLSVEAQVVGLTDDGAPSGLVEDVASWRTLADDEGHWLHDVASRYGFSCALGSPGSRQNVGDVADTPAEVQDVLEQLAQSTNPQDEKIDFWADEAMLILEQLRLGADSLESEDTAVMPDTEAAAQLGDWLSSALAGTDDMEGGQDEEEQWGGIILDGEEEERYWAQYEAEMQARDAADLPVDDDQVDESRAAGAHTSAGSHQDAEGELDAARKVGADHEDPPKVDGSDNSHGKSEDRETSTRQPRSRRRKRAESEDGGGVLEEKQLPGQDVTASGPIPDKNGCTTFACHYACPPGTKKTGLNQNCCGDGLCLNIENEERCPVDCAGVIVNGMIGPGTYVDPSVKYEQRPVSAGMDDGDERVPMAREEAGTMQMQDGKQALPVVWVQKSRIDEYRAQGFRTLENLLGANAPLTYAPHPQQGGNVHTPQRRGIPFDPTKTTQAQVQAEALAGLRQSTPTQGTRSQRAWSTQMPTTHEIEQSKALARRAAGAIQCNTCLFLLQDLWGKVIGVGANNEEQQAVHRTQFGTENDIIAAVEKMCGPQGSAAPFRGAYLLEEAKDCRTHPMAGCGHQGFSLRRRQPPLPADIVPLSWRTDALKLACNDLANALDIEIAEKFYSLTNGKALYELSREEMARLKAHERDMIVDLCSERCVGLTIRSSQTVGAVPPQHENGRVVHTADFLKQQQQRLNQMNQPAKPTNGGIYPRKNHQRQLTESSKQQHAQSAMHASVLVNAAINAAKHDQLPPNQKAKTVLDALEHRTLAAARARQQQEKEREVVKAFEQSAQAQAQREKNEMERRTGQEAAANLLKAVQSTAAAKAAAAQPNPADVTATSKQQAETSTAESHKQPAQEHSGTTASASVVAESNAEQVHTDEPVTSASEKPNQQTEEKKPRKEKRTRGNKGKTKKMRKKTAMEEL